MVYLNLIIKILEILTMALSLPIIIFNIRQFSLLKKKTREQELLQQVNNQGVINGDVSLVNNYSYFEEEKSIELIERKQKRLEIISNLSGKIFTYIIAATMIGIVARNIAKHWILGENIFNNLPNLVFSLYDAFNTIWMFLIPFLSFLTLILLLKSLLFKNRHVESISTFIILNVANGMNLVLLINYNLGEMVLNVINQSPLDNASFSLSTIFNSVSFILIVGNVLATFFIATHLVKIALSNLESHHEAKKNYVISIAFYIIVPIIFFIFSRT